MIGSVKYLQYGFKSLSNLLTVTEPESKFTTQCCTGGGGGWNVFRYAQILQKATANPANEL